MGFKKFAVDKEELIARLDAPVNFQMVAHLTGIIKNHNPGIDVLLQASFHKRKEVAFRAAWMLEYMMSNNPAVFSPYLTRFLELLPTQKNPSVMRHYSKIVALLTAGNAGPLYKALVKEIEFEAVVEVLFIWLVDTEMPVATKVHCMQALANLAPRYDWIKDDLMETIDYLTDVESIAFFARAKQVKKQLMKLKK
ncbi:MAG TPA: hypothetical protein VK541_05570 [Pedobacter sp.]|uniref:hypothetical protein n=1 Tax=Pedobacter sp. TaxID=1411316 RepID=UPI002C5A6477|nr:hypothetical protein [Pedobacter sp.]HMI01929.1 hypothetical protein [Pedobacter sp.]